MQIDMTQIFTRSRLLATLLLLVLVLIIGLAGKTVLQGSLTDDRVLTLIDTNRDSIATVQEMRAGIVAVVMAKVTQNLSYDLDGNSVVNVQDVRQFIASIRALLSANCGNASVEAGEQCDDGNTLETDQCSNTCRLPVCGNGLLQGSEQCDDGNAVNADSCSNICRTPVCGDAIRQESEQCDDGNLIESDGCTASCRVPYCGNGVAEDSEYCDDGNGIDDDTCSNACKEIASTSSVCTSESTLALLGVITQTGAMTGISSVTVGSTVYVATAVSKTNGTVVPTVYRLVKDGSGLRWAQDATFPGFSPTFVADNIGIKLYNLRGVLYAVRTVLPYAWTTRATESMVYKRNAFGQWEGLGAPWVSPYAPQIIDLLEKNSVLYAVTRNYGNVFRYDGDKNWSPLGVPAITATASGIAQIIGAGWNGDVLIAVLSVPPTATAYVWNGTSWSWINAALPENSLQVFESGDGLYLNGISRYTTNFVLYRLGTSATGLLTGVYNSTSLRTFLRQNGRAFNIVEDGQLLRHSDTTGGFVTAGANVTASLLPLDPDFLLSSSFDATKKNVTLSCKKLRVYVCGNGQIEGTEQCDDGNTVGDDACTNSCWINTCGDGIVQGGEQCDDGNRITSDACSNSCRAARCGDGFTNTASEQCDDGNTSNIDACTTSCRTPICGDGHQNQLSEQCDDGNAVNTDACKTNCTAAICGDAIIQLAEQCDDGNANDIDLCSNSCTRPICGDGIQQTGEQCDDGNGDSTDGCNTACRLPVCRNGIREGAEECDDNNASNSDFCTNTCRNARCGDAFVQIGEACDDGNTINTDACSNQCMAAVCGDSIVQPATEQCDDGANALFADGCTPQCSVSPVVPSLCGVGSFKAVSYSSAVATQAYQSSAFFYPTSKFLFLADSGIVSYFDNTSWRSAGGKESVVDGSGFNTSTRDIQVQTALYYDVEAQTLYLGTYSGDTWKQQVLADRMEGTWHFLGRLSAPITSFTKKNGKIYTFSAKTVYEASPTWDYTRGYWTITAAFPSMTSTVSASSRIFFAEHDTLVQAFSEPWPLTGGGNIWTWTGSPNHWVPFNNYYTAASTFGGLMRDGGMFISSDLAAVSPMNMAPPPVTLLPRGTVQKGLYGAYNITADGVYVYPHWSKLSGVTICTPGTSALSCLSSDDFTDWKGEYWKFNADAKLSCMKMP